LNLLPESVLKRVFAATAAQSVRRADHIQRLWSGYGELVRLWLVGGSQPSVIVKLVQPGAAMRTARAQEQRSHARKLQSYDIEMRFYERYASRCGDTCRVARALLCEQLGDQWLFVLEDLDGAGFGERREQLPPHALRACLSWLAHFHAAFIGEMAEGLHPVGTYWHLETRPDELARMDDEELRAAASWLDAKLRGARYRTLVHGDAKVENFCFSRGLTTVAAVDFQYVGGGIGVQDVAYFLSSCLDDHACDAHASALLDFYFETLREALATTQPEVDAATLEVEWRELYPIAWADFCRFMNGWAPAYPMRIGYAARMTELALAALGKG
jgi:hypothetical protein